VFAQELPRWPENKAALHPVKGDCRSNSVLMIARWGGDVKKKHNSRYVFRSESTRYGVYEFIEFVEFIGFIEVPALVVRLKA
jgi:hypothetical protein